MYKIKVYSVGKSKESWLDDAIAEYSKRLRPYLQIEWHLLKDRKELETALLKERSFICLTPEGKTHTSESFAHFVEHAFIDQGSRLNFVIGDAEGLPDAIKQRSTHRISLSSLTFTHQLARLILIEQLYRAFEIRRGSPYHK